MRWWLLYWVIGSGVFFLGWVFGIVMAKSSPESPAAAASTYCWRCYVDLVSERVATGNAVTVANGELTPSRVP